MYCPACYRRPLLLLYLGAAGLASAQELPPLNPASEGLTPERIAEIRRIFQVESETTSSDQSIRIVGDCISYPDKSTLLSFTEDVRAALERTLRAPSAKTTDDSRAVTFRGPQFRILIRGSLSEPDAISNGAPASVRSRLASNRTGTETRPGLTLLLTNPGPQLDPHELSEHIVDGLIRLKILSMSAPDQRPTPPPAWFTRGITRTFDPQGRQPDYDHVRSLYFAGKLPPAGYLTGTSPALVLAEPAIATELLSFWLSYPDVPGRFRTLCQRLAAGDAWTPALFFETCMGVRDPVLADRAFDAWMADRTSNVLSLGLTTPEFARRTAVRLQLFPGRNGVPAELGDSPLPMETLLEPAAAAWAPEAARHLRAEALRAAAGRGDAFREACETIADILKKIEAGRPPRNAARLLGIAREQILNSANVPPRP